MKKQYETYTVVAGFDRPSLTKPSEPSTAQTSSVEEWYRLPHPKGGRLFGLSRSVLYKLAQEGHIKSVSLRKRGTMRGVRLIYGPSLQEFLMRQLEEQNKSGR